MRAARAACAAICLAVMAMAAAVAEAQFDLQTILSKLDRPIPAEALGYAKRAGPYVKMLTTNIKPEECKEGWERLADNVIETADKDEEMTVLQLLKHVCDVGDECFSGAIKTVQTLVEKNALIKSLVDSQLTKTGMSMDQIAAASPLMYMTGCSQIRDRVEEENADGTDKEL